MRLSPKEVKAILISFRSILSNISFELYLFGSRTDDNKKGGDIDLLLVVENLSEKEKLIDLKSKIKSEIFKYIPEQKIDITIAYKKELSTDDFLLSISNSLKKLT